MSHPPDRRPNDAPIHVRPTSSPVRKTWKDAGRPKPPPKGGK